MNTDPHPQDVECWTEQYIEEMGCKVLDGQHFKLGDEVYEVIDYTYRAFLVRRAPLLKASVSNVSVTD